MALRIERFPDTAVARAAAVRFNERLRQGGETAFELMESPFSRHRPDEPGSAMWQHYYLALDETAGAPLEARGGYILQYQRYKVGPEAAAPLAFLRLPLSEGVINKHYAAIGMLLLRDGMKREPVVCSLGMGGINRPLPRLMAGLQWHVEEIPFRFLVLNPFRFLKQAKVLRNKKRFMPLVCDIAAWSGLGWLGLKALQFRPSSRPDPQVTVACEPEFGPWADEIWQASAPAYSFCGERNRQLLNTLYPTDDPRWIRLLVRRGGKPVGWALLLCTATQNHKQFGSMRLGSIADCLAAPEDAALVVRAAVAELRKRGADVVVTNQNHSAWNAALKSAGFLSGPSNFVWAISPGLKARLEPLAETLPHAHINRGDGDGPINL